MMSCSKREAPKINADNWIKDDPPEADKLPQTARLDNSSRIFFLLIPLLLAIIFELIFNHGENDEKKGLVTISGHPKDEIAPGTLNSVLK